MRQRGRRQMLAPLFLLLLLQVAGADIESFLRHNANCTDPSVLASFLSLFPSECRLTGECSRPLLTFIPPHKQNNLHAECRAVRCDQLQHDLYHVDNSTHHHSRIFGGIRIDYHQRQVILTTENGTLFYPITKNLLIKCASSKEAEIKTPCGAAAEREKNTVVFSTVAMACVFTVAFFACLGAFDYFRRWRNREKYCDDAEPATTFEAAPQSEECLEVNAKMERVLEEVEQDIRTEKIKSAAAATVTATVKERDLYTEPVINYNVSKMSTIRESQPSTL